MSKPAITLPPSLTPEHPDYTRERYSLDQAAEYLQTSRAALYSLVAKNAIGHAIGTRRRKLFAQSDLDQFRASRRRGPAVSAISPDHAGAGGARRVTRADATVLQLPKVRRFS